MFFIFDSFGEEARFQIVDVNYKGLTIICAIPGEKDEASYPRGKFILYHVITSKLSATRKRVPTFGNRKEQLANLNLNYQAFVQAVKDLSPEGFLKSLGNWTPRDIVAHFIGWNHITLVGCAELPEGVEPFYFFDGTNDYRKVNAKFFERYNSTD